MNWFWAAWSGKLYAGLTGGIESDEDKRAVTSTFSDLKGNWSSLKTTSLLKKKINLYQDQIICILFEHMDNQVKHISLLLKQIYHYS